MYSFDNDMFSMLDMLFGQTLKPDRVINNGLKTIISKPHNLYTIRNKDTNEIESYMIKLVYTPFTKDDVKVSISDGVLSVTIGNENKTDDEGLVYRGISNQCSTFSFRITDTNVDCQKISAKADDGILTITLPVLPEKKPEVIDISID